MGFDSPCQIPVIDFSVGSSELERGTEGWHHLCKRVREACENYGCFEVVYGKISLQLQAETFSAVEKLFTLPSEIKKKNVNPKPYHGYARAHSILPLYESFGIEDASGLDSVRSFVELMWPDGNDLFSQTISSIIKQLDDLNCMTGRSILDSYGLGEDSCSDSDSIMACKTLLRLMKYEAPPNGEYMDGLIAHTDKPLSALLCSNQVSGVEVETKDGQWIKVLIGSISSSSRGNNHQATKRASG